MKETCSNCNNKQGKVTKEYCLSNPLNPNHEEEPDWEHYGGWHISQAQNCKEFCKENDIPNMNEVDSFGEELNVLMDYL